MPTAAVGIGWGDYGNMPRPVADEKITLYWNSQGDEIVNISAENTEFRLLNEKIRNSAENNIYVSGCCGQRFIGSGLDNKALVVEGTPGNALGSYLNGASIHVHGNAQDAVGDTMNCGEIIIHGNAGDALGYSMRGGKIFVRGDAGYRTGIHMKEYRDKKPVIVVGGRVGSFLGEYLAGGVIVVLGLGCDEPPVGNFTGTGMHGGAIFIRTETELKRLPEQVSVAVATESDIAEIAPYIAEFAEHFGMDTEKIMRDRFYMLRPNAKNPYKRLYVAN